MNSFDAETVWVLTCLIGPRVSPEVMQTSRFLSVSQRVLGLEHFFTVTDRPVA